MIVVGLTGGMGSGKSTVTEMFSALGIPIFISDNEGKRLLNTSKVVRKKVINLLGSAAYINNIPDRKYIASQVFTNKELLSSLNKIIHPKVAKNFERWANKQNAPYCIKESAILFETGGDKICDAVITVEVSLEVRKERILKRDKISLKEIEARLQNQKDDNYRKQKANYVITNYNLEDTQLQVNKIHAELLTLSMKR